MDATRLPSGPAPDEDITAASRALLAGLLEFALGYRVCTAESPRLGRLTSLRYTDGDDGLTALIVRAHGWRGLRPHHQWAVPLDSIEAVDHARRLIVVSSVR